MTVTGKTRLAAVLGWPVTHSRSPQIMNAAFAAAVIDGVMVPMSVPPDGLRDVVAALRAVRAFGASVTIPHKLAVMSLCDELTDGARAIGAVNCLQITDDGRAIGHNTDAPGYIAGLVDAGFPSLRADVASSRIADGAHAVLLGGGGAARAVAYGLHGIGCGVEVIARRPAEVAWAAARAWTPDDLRDAFGRADLVVDCTPVGLGEGDERAWVEALPLDALRREAWISTLIYHRSTLLLERARATGHPVVDGRGMLVHQAAIAFAHWTDLAAPVAAMSAALDASLAGT